MVGNVKVGQGIQEVMRLNKLGKVGLDRLGSLLKLVSGFQTEAVFPS